MWILTVIRWLYGSVKIEFSGDSLERVFGICARNKIRLFAVSKVDGKLVANVSFNDFKKTRKVLRKQGLRVHIIQKSGLPIFIQKKRNRIGFALGMLIFSLILIILQSRIWRIEITGADNIRKNDILNVCENNGIVIGGSKRKIDTSRSALNLSTELGGISWVAVNIEGTTVSVEIREEKEAEFNTESAPSNLIAAYDGIVKSVEVTSGYSLVKPGDSVASGDILVEGKLELATGAIEFVNSSGKIMAQTNRKLTVSIPVVSPQMLVKSKPTSKIDIFFFGINLPLYFAKKDFSIMSEDKNIAVINSVPLPISYTKTKFLQTENREVALESEELLLIARAKINKVISSLDAEEICVIDEDFSIENDAFILTWTINAVENIIYEESFEFFSSNS